TTAAAVMIFAGFLLNSEQTLAQQTQEIIHSNLASMRMAQEVRYSFVLYDDLIFRYLATDDPVLLVEAERAREKMRSWMESLKDLSQSPTEKELLADLNQEV